MPDVDTEWIQLVFGQPAKSYFEWPAEVDRRTRPCGATLARLSDVFEHPLEYLSRCEDHSLNQAFWYLGGGSGVFGALADEGIEWAIRQRLIRSFPMLFRHLFARRCSRALGHRSEGGSPLNMSCYMWWDFDCWVARPCPNPLDPNRLDVEFLDSMKDILSIAHEACQESALHGLGHWHHHHPAAVEAAVDEYLNGQNGASAPPELRDYARAARCGCVQ